MDARGKRGAEGRAFSKELWKSASSSGFPRGLWRTALSSGSPSGACAAADPGSSGSVHRSHPRADPGPGRSQSDSPGSRMPQDAQSRVGPCLGIPLRTAPKLARYASTKRTVAIARCHGYARVRLVARGDRPSDPCPSLTLQAPQAHREHFQTVALPTGSAGEPVFAVSRARAEESCRRVR